MATAAVRVDGGLRYVCGGGRNSRMGEGGERWEKEKLEIGKCRWGEGLRGRGDNRRKRDTREGPAREGGS